MQSPRVIPIDSSYLLIKNSSPRILKFPIRESATCMIIGEDGYVMLLVEPFFSTFTNEEIADATKTTETLIALSADSPEKVDEMVTKALEAGVVRYKEADDQGFMYGWGFQYLDGRLWEVFYVDPSTIN